MFFGSNKLNEEKLNQIYVDFSSAIRKSYREIDRNIQQLKSKSYQMRNAIESKKKENNIDKIHILINDLSLVLQTIKRYRKLFILLHCLELRIVTTKSQSGVFNAVSSASEVIKKLNSVYNLRDFSSSLSEFAIQSQNFAIKNEMINRCLDDFHIIEEDDESLLTEKLFEEYCTNRYERNYNMGAKGKTFQNA